MYFVDAEPFKNKGEQHREKDGDYQIGHRARSLDKIYKYLILFNFLLIRIHYT
jgi:hypothetical protein